MEPVEKAGRLYDVYRNTIGACLADRGSAGIAGRIPKTGLGNRGAYQFPEGEVDGKYGLIDHDGQWAVPCEFDSLYCGYGGKYALEKYSDSEGGSESHIYEPGVGLHRVTPDERGPEGSDPIIAVTGTAVNPVLCYVPDRDGMYQFSDACVWSVYGASPGYPTRALLYTGDPFKGDGADWFPEFDGDIYVLTDGKRPFSDERYQSIGCVAEGIVPARRSGGEWEYLDTAGNVVIPFEYDGKWGVLALKEE